MNVISNQVSALSSVRRMNPGQSLSASPPGILLSPAACRPMHSGWMCSGGGGRSLAQRPIILSDLIAKLFVESGQIEFKFHYVTLGPGLRLHMG